MTSAFCAYSQYDNNDTIMWRIHGRSSRQPIGAIVASTIAPTVAATIAPCIRRITMYGSQLTSGKCCHFVLTRAASALHNT